jgi:ferrous iron transport protein A
MILNNLQLSLDEIKPGMSVRLRLIPDSIRTNLIRLGLCTGDKVKCIAKIPKGPVVLAKGLQELAIGKTYASKIKVSVEGE